MNEPINPEIGGNPEQLNESAEKHEPTPELDIEGALEMLEAPPDGSFLQGLQTFVAWVKNLVD